MNLIKLVILIPLWLTGCAGVPGVNPNNFQPDPSLLACASPARYLVTFTAFWSALTHPQDFPSDPHFSPLIGGTHNDAVQFWTNGGLASPGMENMAENGRVSPLDEEIQGSIHSGNAEEVIRGGGIGPSPGETSASFDISQDFNYVTLVSMVAPSPDWFVGVHDLNLCGTDGNWTNEMMLELFPYDAGTDNGVTYTSPDNDTQPRDPIGLLQVAPVLVNGSVPSMGMFHFVRVEN